MKERVRLLLKDYFEVILAAAFTIGVFSLLELYVINYSEFWFGIKEIIIVSLITFMLIFIALFVLFFIIKKAELLSIIIFSFTISFYIQGNYANADFGILNGVEIEWSKYQIYNTVSIFVWILPIICCLFFFLIKKEKPLFSAIKIISRCMILMEMLSLCIVLSTNSTDMISRKEEQKGGYITDQHLLELAPEKNLIVLCLDSFDSSEYMSLIEADSQYKLEDFTYYRDTAGLYPTTVGAIPYILTGQLYYNQMPRNEYLENAYKDCELYTELRKNDYSIDIYTQDVLLSNSIKNEIDNVEKTSVKVNNYLKFGLKYLKLVGFRYAPNQIKNYFWFYPGEFENYRVATNGNYSVFSSDMQQFYHRLLNEKCIVNSKMKNAFKFYHLYGMHVPYSFDENLQTRENATAQDAAKGNMLLVKEFIKQLQELGIYDNSTIVILADHGSSSYQMQMNPILLIKEEQEKKEFTISEAPISYEYLMPTLLYYVTKEKNRDDTIYHIADNEERSRKFFWYTWTDSDDFSADYLPTISEYIVRGKAFEEASLHHGIHKFYPDEIITFNDEYTVQYGEDILFDGGKEFWELVDSGVSIPEASENGIVRCWSFGDTTVLSLRFEEKVSNDLLMEISAQPLTTDQIMEIYVDDKWIETIENVDNNMLSVYIPNKYIADKTQIEIKLKYPNAISPFNLGVSADKRKLSFYFEKIRFSAIQNTPN